MDRKRKAVIEVDRGVISDGNLRDDRIFSCVSADWRFQAVFPRGRDGPVLKRALFNQRDDPGEEVDVISAHEKVVQELEGEIWRRLRMEARLTFEGRAAGADPLVTERLRNLGYVE